MYVLIEQCNEEHYNLLKRYFDVFFDLNTFLNQKKYIIYTLRNENEILGICLVYSFLSPKGNNLSKIIYTVVETGYRGNGYNDVLLDAVYKNSQTNKIKYIIANIRQSNHSSMKSFIKNGYRVSNVLTKPYKNKEKKIRVVQFIKEKPQSV